MTSAESPVSKTPEWLEALERKRKRPHKLAHDVGAGAPCLLCKDKCTGLNLHFWRKLCIECKCRKEDHEILEDEDCAQFEILFGAMKVKRTTLRFNAKNKSFDWIPPNVTQELAVDYLKALPQSRLPISNSEGARYRKQQLEKQVPLHDVDPNACHDLSEKEMKEFEKYVNNLKSNVIGQGKISKYQLPEILRANYLRERLENLRPSRENCGSWAPRRAEVKSIVSVDRLPSFDVSSRAIGTESYPSDQLLNVKLFKYCRPASSTETDFRPMKSAPLEKRSGGSRPPFSNPKPFGSLDRSEAEAVARKKADDRKGSNLRTPSSFLEKKHPMHDSQNNNALRDDNWNERSWSEDWGPRGAEQVEAPSSLRRDPLERLAELSVSSDEVPFARVQESGRTAPVRITGGTAPEKERSQEEDVSSSFPEPPATCQQCLEILYPEEVIVKTERAGNLALWHAKCFVCETCKELLVDLVYFYHKGKVYCGRHYADMMNIPRCYACDELIFVKEYTCAEGKSYHVRHFCCFHCDRPLGGKQYIPKECLPVCLDCYQVKYGKDCRTCRLGIGPGEQRISWQDLDFHAAPECFRCAACLKSLLGGRFVVKNANTFCSKECVLGFSE